MIAERDRAALRLARELYFARIPKVIHQDGKLITSCPACGQTEILE